MNFNFTWEQLQWTLHIWKNELYLRTFFKDCSRWYWGHVQLTWFEAISLELLVNPILQKTVFFLDSTRHLNLHEMPHLIIKCSQLVILSTCFFWNSMSLLVKNIRTIQGYLRLSLRLMYSNAVQIAKTYENYLELSWKHVLMHFDIYVVVSRIDSFFLGGVTTQVSYTPGLQEIPFEFLMNFLWMFMIFFCIF